MKPIAIIAAVVQLLCATAYGQTPPPHRDTMPTVAEVFGWLPLDTETLIVIDEPFFLPKESSNQPTATMRAGLTHFVEWGLEEFRDGLVREQLMPHRVRLALHAARKFREPAGLGSFPFEGADILVFEEPIGNLLKEVSWPIGNRLEEISQGDRIEIGGFQVWRIFERVESGDWTFLLVQLDEQTVVLATDEGFLRTIIQRRSLPGTEDRALPESLGFWPSLDTNAPVWGVRYLRLAETLWEGSYPPEYATEEALRNSPQAEASFTFSLDEDDLLKARWATHSEDKLASSYLAFVGEAWAEFSGYYPFLRDPTLRTHEPGVIEVEGTYDPETEGAYSGMAFSFLPFFLGHQMAL